MIMETNYPTIAGKDLIWHTDPNDKPYCSFKNNIIVAYAYKSGDIADRVYFDAGDMYLGDKDDTYQIAWAEFDRSTADMILQNILEKRKEYEREHAAEIKAKRIAKLEAELAELKK